GSPRSAQKPKHPLPPLPPAAPLRCPRQLRQPEVSSLPAPPPVSSRPLRIRMQSFFHPEKTPAHARPPWLPSAASRDSHPAATSTALPAAPQDPRNSKRK